MLCRGSARSSKCRVCSNIIIVNIIMTTTETITDITSISTQEAVDYDDQELRDFLWQMIDQHRLSSSAKDLEDKRHDTTWELVIIQESFAGNSISLRIVHRSNYY